MCSQIELLFTLFLLTIQNNLGLWKSNISFALALISIMSVVLAIKICVITCINMLDELVNLKIMTNPSYNLSLGVGKELQKDSSFPK